MHKNNVQRYSSLALLIGASAFLFLVFAPFIQILTLAMVLAVLFHRPYEYVARRMPDLKGVAAGIVVGAVLVFFIVPLFFLGLQILHEVQGLYIDAQGNGAQYVQMIQVAIQHPIQQVSPDFSFDIGPAISNTLSYVSGNLASIVSQTFYVLLETFLMLLAFFFFLRDGRSLIATMEKASPFGTEEAREILTNMHHTIQSIVKGTLVVGLIRWMFIGAGFYLFHIPNAVLWGSIGGIIGVIPGLGTPFAFIPAFVYLYVEGNGLGAVGLAIFGLATTGFIDNILTPYFFGKGLAVSSIFVLLAILGGILFFGPLGFIMGPLVLSVFLSVFHIYSVQADA